VKKSKRPSREERFLEAFAQETAKFQAATEGLKPHQIEERDRLLAQRALGQQAAIWTFWLNVNGWTPRHAALLFAGHDPRERLLGSARHSGAERRAILNLIERLKALAEEHLKPIKRGQGSDLRRYRPRDWIRVALGPPELGYARALDALAKQLESLRPARNAPVRTKRNVALERSQIVVAVAGELVAEGKGYEQDGDLYLYLRSREFWQEIRARRKDHRLFHRFDQKNLQRARTSRSAGNPLPRVFLLAGRPKGSET
jgi:hypothetical protein